MTKGRRDGLHLEVVFTTEQDREAAFDQPTTVSVLALNGTSRSLMLDTISVTLDPDDPALE